MLTGGLMVAIGTSGAISSSYVGRGTGFRMVVASAALIVALTRPTAMKPATTSTPPTYSAAEVSTAQRQLCDTYKTRCTSCAS